MAFTPRQWILGRELTRILVSMHDQIDCCSFTLRNQSHHDGSALMMPDEITGNPVPATFEYRKELAKSFAQNIINYANRIDAFIGLTSLALVRDSVEAYLGGTAWATVKADYDAIVDEAQYVVTNIDAATTEAQLLAGANRIDSAIPKIQMFRRLWVL